MSPVINSAVSDGRWLTLSEWQGLAAALASFIGVCIGRHEASAPTFTPKGLPGRNKEDAHDVTSNLLNTTMAKLVPLVIEQFANAQTSQLATSSASSGLSSSPIAESPPRQRLLYCLHDSWLLEEPGLPMDISHQGKRIRAARGGLNYTIVSTIVDENGWKQFTTMDDQLQWYGKTDDFQLV